MIRLILRTTEADFNAVFTGTVFWKTMLVANEDLAKLLKDGWSVVGAEVDAEVMQ